MMKRNNSALSQRGGGGGQVSPLVAKHVIQRSEAT